MLYLGDKKATLFKGDRRPVSLYLGDKKVTGYEYAEQTGEHLTFENTYNDSAFVRINGNTQEIGEGDKSPDNPYELKSVEGDLVSAGRNLFDKANYTAVRGYIAFNIDSLVIGQTYTFSINTPITFLKISNDIDGYGSVAKYDANGFTVFTFEMKKHENILGKQYLFIRLLGDSAFLQDIIEVNDFNIQLEPGSTSTPYTPFRGMSVVNYPYTLRSLPDGTKDYIEIDNVAKTARLYRNIKELILDGSPLVWWTGPVTGGLYQHNLAVGDNISMSRCYCTHYAETLINLTNGIYFGNSLNIYEPTYTTKSEWLSFLAAQHSAGTPVTVQYKLANPPEPIELDYNEIKTFYPFTQTYTTATVQPTLDGKFRVWGS